MSVKNKNKTSDQKIKQTNNWLKHADISSTLKLETNLFCVPTQPSHLGLNTYSTSSK